MIERVRAMATKCFFISNATILSFARGEYDLNPGGIRRHSNDEIGYDEASIMKKRTHCEHREQWSGGSARDLERAPATVRIAKTNPLQPQPRSTKMTKQTHLTQ